MITIIKFVLNYGSDPTVDVSCTSLVRTPFGDVQTSGVVNLVQSQALPQAGWTDEDLRLAVATSLQVASNTVQFLT